MQKYEKEEDSKRQRQLRDQLEKCLKKYEEEPIQKVSIELVEKIVKIYKDLGREGFEYDQKDCLAKKKLLAEMRYEKMQKDHMDSREAESWKDFEKEEEEER